MIVRPNQGGFYRYSCGAYSWQRIDEYDPRFYVTDSTTGEVLAKTADWRKAANFAIDRALADKQRATTQQQGATR